MMGPIDEHVENRDYIMCCKILCIMRWIEM